MRSHTVTRGFTLIELLVVIAIIAILASILFPVFARARAQARKIQCTSNVRQLAMAVQMYAQDNGGRYPGAAWHTALENYAGSQKIFFCPEDAVNDKSTPISYGYGGVLVRADGTGCNEAQVRAPSAVGAIADATPSRLWTDGGGLIGGGALADPTTTAAGTAVEVTPRHTGVVVGFCDGHAAFFPGNQVNLKDIQSGPGRAFYQAVGLGYVQNYGGGLQLPNAPTGIAPTANAITIGGDYATMPILMAAAETWAAKGGKWLTRGFKGSGDVANVTTATARYPDWRRTLASTQFAWGIADNKVQAITPGANQALQDIGRDAFVFIVSKNCKLTTDDINTDSDTDTAVTLRGLFGVTGTDKGYSADKWQAYTYDANSGSRKYAQSAAVLNGPIGSLAQTVQDDQEMVEKVAADPYGIGYCSAAFADTDKVTILGIGGKTYPNQNPKYRWVVRDTPGTAAGEFEYPFIRILRVLTMNDGRNVNNTTFGFILADTEFQNGPLFRATSYWTP
jgi:prepilin-type N-terminal cleavage/methylation domain-containing protein